MKEIRPRDFLSPAKVKLSQVSVCPQAGVCHTPGTDTPLDKTPGQTPPCPVYAGIHPPVDTMGYGQQADGTHPARMHSCFFVKLKNITRRALFLCHSKGPMFL